MSIGERITKLRTERNISQNQLAKAMEVSRQAVSKWENGQSTPDATKMIKLAELLDTDLEYLTTGRIVVPSRPPVVLETVKTVEKVVERPVEVVVEKPVIIEKVIEQLVPVEVEKTVVRKVVRTKYALAPVGSILLAIGCFLLGLILGLLL